MKRMCSRMLLVVSGLVWCGVLSASGQSVNLDSILKLFPGSHSLTLQERDPELRAFLVKHFPKSDPSVVRADFDGDGTPDYALLLKDDKTTKLVVLLCSADSKCKKVHELDETAYADSVYLRPVSMGSIVSQTGAVEGKTPPVKLHSTGIQVTYFEKGKVVLYWNRKLRKIEELQTGD